MTVNITPINLGSADDAGDGDVGLRGPGAKINANDAALKAFADGSGLDGVGRVQADPTGATDRAIAAGDDVATALWLLQKQQGGAPANLRWVGTWDASTNSPDLTQAVNQGETDAATGLFTGYAYQVSLDGDQDLGVGLTDFNAGDWVHFGQGGAVYHSDNSSTVVNRGVVTGAQTLPAATGSGRVYLYQVDAAGTAVTLAPAAGEALNALAADGTMSFALPLTIIRAVDNAVGAWTVNTDTTLSAEPAETVLIDIDATNNTLHPFSTGQTWAQVKAEFENLRFDINVSDSGATNVKPATVVIPTANFDLFAAIPGWALLSHHGVEVNISDPVDTDTGFTYLQSSGDSPTGGRMQFRVTGIRRQHNAIRAEDLGIYTVEETLVAGPSHNVTVPATVGGKQMVGAEAWINFTGTTWAPPQLDGINNWVLRWDPAGVVTAGERIGVFAGAVPIRVIAKYA